MKITSLNDIQNYELPRKISIFLKINIMFGNVPAFLGIVFFLMGSVFAIIFGALSDLDFSNPLAENPGYAKGIVTLVSQTSASENEQHILKYTYKFTGDNNKEYVSNSFSNDPQGIFEKDTIVVKYSKNEPSISQINFMRRAPFDGWVFLLTLLFPLVGLCFLIFAIIKGRKNISLVQNGYLTSGKVVGKEPTNTRINNRTVYKMFFEYTGTDGVLRKAYTRTHRPELVEDEAQEKLLFNVSKPDEAILVDALPRAVKKFFMKMES